MVAALVGIHLVLMSAGIAPSRLGWIWRLTAPTMVMIVVLWALLYPGEGAPLLAWRFIHITASSLARGAAVALRVGALGFLIVVWLFTTDQSELVRGLVALGLPYTWGLTLAIALRYLPTMAGTFRSISEAQQARALDLGGRNPVRRARAYLPIVVAMLITALRTAEHLSCGRWNPAPSAPDRGVPICTRCAFGPRTGCSPSPSWRPRLCCSGDDSPAASAWTRCVCGVKIGAN